MPVDANLESTRDLERMPITETSRAPSPMAHQPETLRVRCPHCRKLYLVQFSDIQEAKPRFECVQCHARFWLAMADMDLSGEVSGIPLQVKELPQKAPRAPSFALKKEDCPKCHKPLEAGRGECPSCGVVPEKYKALLTFQEGVPPHSPTLSALWKRVVNEYADEGAHGEFIKACQRERNLAYAAAQYAQMQRLLPTDETTAQRLKEVQGLASLLMSPSERDKGLKAPRVYPRLWQMPLMAATIVMIVGMVLPTLRNMVGMGAALVFLALALRLHFRKKI